MRSVKKVTFYTFNKDGEYSYKYKLNMSRGLLEKKLGKIVEKYYVISQILLKKIVLEVFFLRHVCNRFL